MCKHAACVSETAHARARARCAQELADALAARGHLAHCAPAGLLRAFEALRPDALLPYPPGDAAPVAAAIDAMCGF